MNSLATSVANQSTSQVSADMSHVYMMTRRLYGIPQDWHLLYTTLPQILLPLNPYDGSNLIRTPFPTTEQNMDMLSDTPEYR